jgi:hypothetical protein
MIFIETDVLPEYVFLGEKNLVRIFPETKNPVPKTKHFFLTSSSSSWSSRMRGGLEVDASDWKSLVGAAFVVWRPDLKSKVGLHSHRAPTLARRKFFLRRKNPYWPGHQSSSFNSCWKNGQILWKGQPTRGSDLNHDYITQAEEEQTHVPWSLQKIKKSD